LRTRDAKRSVVEMSENQRRKAANEAVFRDVNERIESLQRGFAAVERLPLQIVCECDRLDCADQLSVDLDVYERTRSDSSLFLVRRGHEDGSVEDVVDTGSDYIVVRKRPGDPEQIAELTDPRT
jgi:hypothetical protein